MMASAGKGEGPVVLLEATAEPAFAVDTDCRIVAGNKAFEKLLGYRAQKIIGKKCWEVLEGRDVFGNPYCGPYCGARQAFLRNDPVHSFEMDVRKVTGGVVRVVCRTLLVGSEEPTQFTTVHLFQPIQSVQGAQTAMASNAVNDNAGVIPEALSEKNPTITERQLEILRYLADGWSNQAVAQELDISLATVRTHTNNILHRFAVHSIRQAIATARRSGLI